MSPDVWSKFDSLPTRVRQYIGTRRWETSGRQVEELYELWTNENKSDLELVQLLKKQDQFELVMRGMELR